MRVRTPVSGSTVVVKCEDKMETLIAFVGHWLRSIHGQTLDIDGATVLLVARSASSPVARALAASGTGLAAANIRIKAIFTSIAPELSAEGWTGPASTIPFSRDVRWARNPRLADAHEQLVLGHSAVWFGDCMRRDPAKRDAFERYYPSCAQTVCVAERSFHRLWQLTDAFAVRGSVPAARFARQAVDQPADTAPIAAGEAAAVPTVSTRH